MSEIARIRAQIQAEYEASKRAFTDYTITSPHQFITRRMERLESLRKELITQVGETEGMHIFIEASEQFTPEREDPHASF
jgi:hypothetical protein